MSDTVLHYVYDPLCGWCYAAEPLVEAAAAGVRAVLYGGDLWDPPSTPPAPSGGRCARPTHTSTS